MVYRFLATGLIILLSLFSSAPLSALSIYNYDQALELSPPVLNLNADPGEEITTTLKLRNISELQLLIKSSVNDFVANDKDGTPKLILDDDHDNPHSMKSWFSSISDLSLDSQELRNIPITIKIPAGTSPGGYYSVVNFVGVPTNDTNSETIFSASLGAMIFLQVNGEINEKATIDSFYTYYDNSSRSTIFEQTPINFELTVKNTGNVHIQPTGKITVKDMFGNTISSLPINDEIYNILPNSSLEFTQSLDKSTLGSFPLFGFYSATIELDYGQNSDQILSSSTSFWVVPYKVLLIGAAISLAIVFATVSIIKFYKKHKTKQSKK